MPDCHPNPSVVPHFAALRPLALAIHLAVCGGALAVAAHAPAARAQEPAGAQAMRNYDIPAGPLSSALTRFAREAGVYLVGAGSAAAGKTSPGLKGRYGVPDGFAALLAGTGLQAFRQADGAYALRPAPVAVQSASGVAALAAVTVTAQGLDDGVTEDTGSYTTRSSSTATGMSLSLRETPQSVSVITSQRMKDQNLTQLADVVNQTPGLVMSQGANVGSDSSVIYSRGFAVDTYMVDGVKQISSYASIFQSQDMALYDRVDVLRGASGLMNGVGSPGGSINLIRKRPTDAFRAEVTVEGGSWDHKRGVVDLSTPLNAAGSLRGRMVAVLQDSDSYIDRFNDKRKVLYGIVEADLARDTQARGGVSHQRHDLAGHARGGLPAYADDGSRMIWPRSASAGASWAYSHRHGTSMFAELDHRFGNDWKLQVNASRTITDSDELVGYASGGSVNRATGSGVQLWASRWRNKPTQDVLDVSANGSFSLFNREHEAAFGATLSRSDSLTDTHTDWWHENYDPSVPNIYTWTGDVPAAPYNPPIGTNGTEERNNGAYLSLRFRPSDRLSLIVGSRYLDWQRNQSSYRYATGVTTHTNRAARELVPYAGITYDFGRDWTAYASVAKIFLPQNNKRPDGSYIDPLNGQNYEAGVKAALLGGRLNLGAAIYQLRENNKAIAIPDVLAPDGSQAYEGKSGTRTRGLELEAAGAIRPGWEIAASLAHNRTRDRDGLRINTAIPKNVAKLFTSYRINGLGGLTVGGGVRWQSAIYSDGMGPNSVRFTQPSYAVADLMARYDINDHLSAALNVHNLFDRRYYTNTGNSYYGSPRAFVLSLTGRF